MAHTQVMGIIRKRGQLTIPKKIRRAEPWAEPLSAVTISVPRPGTIAIEPATTDQKIDWDVLREKIRRARQVPGKRGNLSAFIAADRARRR